MNSVEANIPKLYAIKAMRWFMLMVPIIVPFFNANGMSQQQIMLLQASFAIAVVALEIPSGYFADIFGRKRSILLGAIFASLGLIIYSQSTSFWGFLVAEMVLGIGSSFTSGADSALMYDSLLELSREKEYSKFEGRNQAAGNFSEAIASVFGGLLAVINIRYPIYVQVLVVLPTILIAFSLHEPVAHSSTKRKPGLRDLFGVIKFILHEHKQLKWLLIYSSSIGCATLMMVWFTQLYFAFVCLPLAFFGIVWAALQFSVGIFSLSANYVEQKIGKQALLIALPFLIGLGYLSLGLTNKIWGLIFLLIFFFVRGMNGPLLTKYVNGLVDPSIRATTLSLTPLLFRLLFAITGPIFGRISDLYSLSTALCCCSLFFFGITSISLFFLKKSGALEN